MKYVWVETGIARDVAFDPSIQFEPRIAELYSVQTDNDNVAYGWLYVDGKFEPPESVEVQEDLQG